MKQKGMKIGTLSLNINTDDLNYGAMLHSWAFQQVLNQINPKGRNEIIDYIPNVVEHFNSSRPVLSYLKMHRYTSAVKISLSYFPYQKRAKKFRSFINSKMKVSSGKYTHSTIAKAKLDYSCLICESDVIWSSTFFNGDFDETFFLAFPNMQDKKKIIYSASMGNGNFTESEMKKFRSLVQYPDAISCRESYAAEIVRKQTDRPAVHVADPVLLLKKEDYACLLKKNFIKKPYLLLYIPVNYDDKIHRLAMNYAKKHHLEVIEISYYTWHKFSHRVISDAGIEEFLTLIKNASAVFTSSFHAVCFSMLFQVQLYAFQRKTGRKTEDILQYLDLSNRYSGTDDFREQPPINYSEVTAHLDTFRNHSLNWLRRALGESV